MFDKWTILKNDDIKNNISDAYFYHSKSSYFKWFVWKISLYETTETYIWKKKAEVFSEINKNFSMI